MNEAQESRPAHAEWELPEVGVAVILLAFVVVVATSAIAGVTAGLASSGVPWRQTVGLALQDATEWSFPFFIFPVVFAVGLVWWQVHTWIGVIDAADSGAPAGRSRTGTLTRRRRRRTASAEAAGDELLAAFDHLLRARTLATWTVPVLGAALVAAIGSVLGDFLNSSNAASGFVWADRVRTIGWAAATGVLAGSAVVVAAYLRLHVDEEFTLAEQAAAAESGRTVVPHGGEGVVGEGVVGEGVVGEGVIGGGAEGGSVESEGVEGAS